MKYVLLVFLFFSSLVLVNLASQNSKIPSNINGEKIINKYLKRIGGIKQIQEIKTLQKSYTTNIKEAPELLIYSQVLYKQPNLYASTSTKEVGDLKQIHEIKYNGVKCILNRVYKDDNIQTNIEGEQLDEIIQEFYPFPILELKKNKQSFKIIEIIKDDQQEAYKIYVEQPNQLDSIFLFFNKQNHQLIKKEVIGSKTTRITEYREYKKQQKILFPFLEISKLIIDGKVAQQSTNRINEIIINQHIDISEFE